MQTVSNRSIRREWYDSTLVYNKHIRKRKCKIIVLCKDGSIRPRNNASGVAFVTYKRCIDSVNDRHIQFIPISIRGTEWLLIHTKASTFIDFKIKWQAILIICLAIWIRIRLMTILRVSSNQGLSFIEVNLRRIGSLLHVLIHTISTLFLGIHGMLIGLLLFTQRVKRGIIHFT